MIRVAILLVLLSLGSHLQAQRYDQELLGRWVVVFQEPPEQKIVEAQLRSLNLGFLMERIDVPELGRLIITISRNKFLIQSDNQLFEEYNCVLEPGKIEILNRQEKLSPVPREYTYRLDGNELLLMGTLNKINNLPVTIKLRRVMAIPTYGDGSRGWMSGQGFLDVGTATRFTGDQVTIARKGKTPLVVSMGQLSPLDQISLHEPELVSPNRIQPTWEQEKERFIGLPYPIKTSEENDITPIYFTKEYYFDESQMDEGYLITIYNTDEGVVKFRAQGSGGGTSRGALNIRFLKDRNNYDRMMLWINDEEIFERPLEEVEQEQADTLKAESAAAQGNAPAEAAEPAAGANEMM